MGLRVLFESWRLLNEQQSTTLLTHRGSLLMKGLSTKLSHVVDDWGEVGGAVKLHLGQTLLVGLDHTFNA